MSVLLVDALTRRTFLTMAGATAIVGCGPSSGDTATMGAASTSPATLRSPASLGTLPGGFPGPVRVYRDAGNYERALAAITPALGAASTGNALYRIPVTGGTTTTNTDTALREAANLGEPLYLENGGELALANNGFYFRPAGAGVGRFVKFPDGYGLNKSMSAMETDKGIWITTANMTNPDVAASGYDVATVLFYPFDDSGNILDNDWEPFELAGYNPTSIGKLSDGRLVILAAGDNFNSGAKPSLNILDPNTGDLTDIDLRALLGFDFVGQFSDQLVVDRDSLGEFVVLGTTESTSNSTARLIKVYLDSSNANELQLADGTVSDVVLVRRGLLVAGHYETGELVSVSTTTFVQTSSVRVIGNSDQRLGRISAGSSGVVAVVNGRAAGVSELVYVGVG